MCLEWLGLGKKCEQRITESLTELFWELCSVVWAEELPNRNRFGINYVLFLFVTADKAFNGPKWPDGHLLSDPEVWVTLLHPLPGNEAHELVSGDQKGGFRVEAKNSGLEKAYVVFFCP